MLREAACVIALISVPAALGAQQASPYIPADDRLLPFVEHLVRAAVIPDPDPLTRPVTRAAVLAALARADTNAVDEVTRQMVRDLIAGLTPRVSGAVVGMHFHGGVSAGTNARRDLLRPAGPDYRAWQAGMDLWTTLDRLVLSSRPFFDRRLRYDPDYAGLERPLSFRFNDAYIGVRSRYIQATLGTVDRNWGPTGIEGLVVSTAPYSYDHLHVRLGSDNFRVETLLAQLNDTLNQAGVFQQRWWITHRFLFQPWPWMRGVLGQGTLWKGGPTQTWLLNPTRLAHLSRLDDNLPDSVNTVLSGDLWIRLGSGAVLQAQGLIDDISLLGDKTAPDRLAGTLAVDVPVRRSASFRFAWTVVSSLAYRTFEGPVTYLMRHNVGLGRNFDDYTQWSLTASVTPRPSVLIRPELTLLLQGAADLRQPAPPYPATNYPFLLVGTVQRTVRVATSLKALAWGHADLSADAGIHFTANERNVLGLSRTCFVGAIAIRYRIGSEYRAP